MKAYFNPGTNTFIPIEENKIKLTIKYIDINRKETLAFRKSLLSITNDHPNVLYLDPLTKKRKSYDFSGTTSLEVFYMMNILTQYNMILVLSKVIIFKNFIDVRGYTITKEELNSSIRNHYIDQLIHNL